MVLLALRDEPRRLMVQPTKAHYTSAVKTSENLNPHVLTKPGLGHTQPCTSSISTGHPLTDALIENVFKTVLDLHSRVSKPP